MLNYTLQSDVRFHLTSSKSNSIITITNRCVEVANYKQNLKNHLQTKATYQLLVVDYWWAGFSFV